MLVGRTIALADALDLGGLAEFNGTSGRANCPSVGNAGGWQGNIWITTAQGGLWQWNAKSFSASIWLTRARHRFGYGSQSGWSMRSVVRQHHKMYNGNSRSSF